MSSHSCLVQFVSAGARQPVLRFLCAVCGFGKDSASCLAFRRPCFGSVSLEVSSLQPRRSPVSWVWGRAGNSANLSPKNRNYCAFTN